MSKKAVATQPDIFINILKNNTLHGALLFVTGLFTLIALPFFVLVRVAVFLHAQYDYPGWLCVFGGVMGSAALLFLYVSYGRNRLLDSKTPIERQIKQNYLIALAAALFYCSQTVLFFSAANAKGAEVQREFRSLHPVLRLGVSTLVYLDGSLMLTDAQRLPEDYKAMGLPSKRYSLHYRQSNGYVHAVDIRTIGHSFVRNGLVKLYFKLLGFRTLRHTGSADHLHVSLKSHDRPGASFRVHPHHFGGEGTEDIYEFALGCHHLADIFVGKRRLVEAAAEEVHPVGFKVFFELAEIDAGFGFAPRHEAPRPVRGRIQRVGLAATGHDVCRRGHRARDDAQHAFGCRRSAFAVHNDFAAVG